MRYFFLKRPLMSTKLCLYHCPHFPVSWVFKHFCVIFITTTAWFDYKFTTCFVGNFSIGFNHRQSLLCINCCEEAYCRIFLALKCKVYYIDGMGILDYRPCKQWDEWFWEYKYIIWNWQKLAGSRAAPVRAAGAARPSMLPSQYKYWPPTRSSPSAKLGRTPTRVSPL